jgi:hypothetical protein
MSEQPPSGRDNIILAAVALLLGATGALAYAAWRYVSADDAASSARWAEFGDAMLFPGALIIAAIAAMVWLGWKANIDG